MVKAYSLILCLLLVMTTACNEQATEDGQNNTTTNTQGSESSDVIASKSIDVMDATFEEISPYISFCRGNNGNPNANAKNKKNEKLCVTVCHVPPGNPDNAKSLRLPLEALNGHIRKNKHPNKKHNDYLGPCNENESDENIDEEPIKEEEDINEEDYTEDEDDEHVDDHSYDDTIDEEDPIHDIEDFFDHLFDCPHPDENQEDSNSEDDSNYEEDPVVEEEYPSEEEPAEEEEPIVEEEPTDEIELPVWCEPIYSWDQDCDGFDDFTGEPVFSDL